MIKLLIILVLLLSSCNVQRITEVLFIASIGIEREGEEYAVYFYLPNSEDVGKANDSGSGTGEFVKLKGESISMVFSMSQTFTELELNLRHCASLIINEELLNNEFVYELIDFFKYENYVDPNFYLFVTTDKLEDVYRFQNPNNESVLNSVIVSVMDSPSLFLAADPVHFLNFCRDFYSGKCIRIPYLIVDKIWNVGEKEVISYHCTDMVLFYNGEYRVVVDDVRCFYLKKNIHFTDKMDVKNVNIKDIIFKYDYGRHNVIINIKINQCEDNINIENIIKDKINDFFIEYEGMDILNINYYNKLYNHNKSYSDISIDVNIKYF